MRDNELFTKNVSHWVLICPKEAGLLMNMEVKDLQFAKTAGGELNIQSKGPGGIEYYHSADGALEEARKWFQSLDLFGIGTLFVYGVGLGYYYLAAKEWLAAEKSRSLIFLEDDLRVIHLLFQTETGGDMLFNKQVRVQYFKPSAKEEDTESNLNSIPYFYFLCNIRISALNSYLKRDPKKLPQIEIQLEYIKNCKGFYLLEYLNYGETFFQNFYRNLLELPSAKLADKMFGGFAGIPAVICGAGPSLEKSLPLLEKLNGKALIFAGGSSINVLNAKGIQPHFGVSIDPNWNQYARLFMNQAFQVPFFYRNRIFPQALSLIQGDHLYITGSGGHKVAEYFEKELGIPEGKKISEGNNVVNFSLSIAEALGCNPIILVGVDLAYTNNQSYSPGIIPHPILDAAKKITTRGSNEELITKRDIYGNVVYTLWKWVNESLWISQFAMTSPRTEILNSTEGGIGFDGVPNVPLSEVLEKSIRNEMDLKTFIHGEIQNASLPESVTKQNIIRVMTVLKESLTRCKELTYRLRQEFHKVLKQMNEEGKIPENLVSEKAFGLLRELNQEIAYENILSEFNRAFIEFFGQRERALEFEKIGDELDPLKLNKKRALMNKKRYEFLKAVCAGSEEYIHEALQADKIASLVGEVFGKEILEATEKKRQQQIPGEPAIYRHEGNRFWIKDSELSLSFEEELVTGPVKEAQEIRDYGLKGESERLHGCFKLLYPTGRLKMEQYYKNGKLHGPVSYYSEDGKLLGRSWFVNGLREGASTYFYRDGSPFSVERFRNGKESGRQEYYYPKGQIKSRLDYQEGKLDGSVVLYYSDGLKKREVNFQKGKRHGAEIVWNFGGIKELEGTYHSDCPVGVFRSWHANGNISRELKFDESGRLEDLKAWDSDGTPLPGGWLMKKDYFDLVQEETNALTGSLENVFKEVESMTAGLAQIASENKGFQQLPDFSEDLKELKMEIENLKDMNREMQQEGESVSAESAEALWKTPEAKRLMGMQIQGATEKMAEDIKALEEIMRLTSELLSEKNKEGGEEEER